MSSDSRSRRCSSCAIFLRRLTSASIGSSRVQRLAPLALVYAGAVLVVGVIPGLVNTGYAVFTWKHWAQLAAIAGVFGFVLTGLSIWWITMGLGRQDLQNR